MTRSNDNAMPIVCGTDFSEMAGQAATVAATLAAATGRPLHLVHALDLWPEEVREQPGHPLVLWGESRLGREAARLRLLGAEVLVQLVPGATEDVLRGAARDTGAALIVVGALGHRGETPRKLGSRADRTAQHSHVPVLAVRDAAPFLTWQKEKRPLRVVLGVDASASAEHAARWLDGLCGLGPCEIVLAHLYWPPETFHRLGFGGLRSFVEPDAEIVGEARRLAEAAGGSIELSNDAAAIKGAKAVYTDAWTSMGDESEAAQRRKAFARYRVNAALMAKAPDAKFMHCLPAHRGEEVTDDVIDSAASIVYDQAENRLHAQNALMLHVLGAR